MAEEKLENAAAKWRFNLRDDGTLHIRLFEIADGTTPRIFTHMPSGNQVILDPTLES